MTCPHGSNTGDEHIDSILRPTTVPFNNMRILKFKVQPTNAFSLPSSRPPSVR